MTRITLEEQASRIKFFRKLIDSGELYLKDGNLYKSHTHEIAGHETNGYLYIIRRINGRLTGILEHRLLYCYYHDLEAIPVELDINHIDFNRSNNREENLELLTRKDNMRHSANSFKGLNRGAKNGNTNLTEEEAQQIKDLATRKIFKQREIAELYNTSTKAVGKIKRGEKWKHLK